MNSELEPVFVKHYAYKHYAPNICLPLRQGHNSKGFL